MHQTPYSKRRGWPKTKAPFTPRKKGLFEDGQWLCECRKPALCLTVKKEGPNKGKLFYECDGQRCDFFLWETDAKVRERDALMTHNCRSENGLVGRVQAKDEPPATPSFAPIARPPPRSAPQQRLFKGVPTDGRSSMAPSPDDDSDFLDYDTDDAEETQHVHAGSFDGSSQTAQNGSGFKSSASASAPPPPPLPRGPMPDFIYQQPAAGNATPSVKRKRDAFLSDSEEDFLDDSDVDENELVAAADESVRKKLFQTPAAERTIDRVGGAGDLPTPWTRMHRNSLLIAGEDREQKIKRPRLSGLESISDVDGTPSQSQSLPAGQGHALYISDMGTPTPYRKTDAFAPASSETPSSALMSSPRKTPADIDFPKIVDEAMELLAGQPQALQNAVRQTLRRYELRMKGVVMGREAVRRDLDERDQKIAELQARIVDLENARRFDRGRLLDKNKLRQFTEHITGQFTAQLADGLLSLSQHEEQ